MTSYGISPAPNEQRYATAGPGAQAIHRPTPDRLSTTVDSASQPSHPSPVDDDPFLSTPRGQSHVCPAWRARSRLRCNIDDTLLPSFSHCALPLTG
jgi:hypothetical protein